MLLIIRRVAIKVLSFYYNDIWQLKKRINSLNESVRKGLLQEIYDNKLGKMGSWIGISAHFEDIPVFPHGMYGFFVSKAAKIGSNCVIFQHVTIGSNTLPDSKSKGAPTIGRNCYIGAGAKIIGNVKIGDNCRIGSNCVVFKDMPDNSVAVLQPPRIILKNHLDNKYYSPEEVNIIETGFD